MTLKKNQGNTIEKSAKIVADVTIGSYNYIGKNVVIGGFRGQSSGTIKIGDCNYIHDNTRILMGIEGLSIGDWNVFHNNMLIMGQKRMEIGHNCWFGQGTILDSAGELYIGNGVRIGMNSQIWTHVASGELIEGCSLFAMRPTHIEDDVWLVGSCIVGSGLRLRRRSICMIGSLLSKDTDAGKVYGGTPAKQLEKLNFWKKVSLHEKMQMMCAWAKQFMEQSAERVDLIYQSESMMLHVIHQTRQERLVFCTNIGEITDITDSNITYFDLETKKYTKRLTQLEREFYKYIYDHKARFIPIENTNAFHA